MVIHFRINQKFFKKMRVFNTVAITGAINGMSQMKICIKLGLESLKFRQ